MSSAGFASLFVAVQSRWGWLAPCAEQFSWELFAPLCEGYLGYTVAVAYLFSRAHAAFAREQPATNGNNSRLTGQRPLAASVVMSLWGRCAGFARSAGGALIDWDLVIELGSLLGSWVVVPLWGSAVGPAAFGA